MGSKAIRLKDISGNSIYPCPYFPVGSIYMSVNSTNPSTFFGGTWERIQDRFLLCAGSTYTAGKTGGSANHTHTNPTTGAYSGTSGSTAITIAQMPSHSHTLNQTGRPLYWDSGMAEMGGLTSGTNVQYTWDCGTQAVGGGQGHTHSIPSHTHTQGATGSSSNIPPYLAVYVWKRTA